MRFVFNLQILRTNILTHEYKSQIRMASSLSGSEDGITQEEEFEGCKIKVTRGDYGALIGKVAEHLKEASVRINYPVFSSAN
jgi:hypothetical protein